MAIAFRDSSSAEMTAGVSPVVTRPSSVVAGDVLLAMFITETVHVVNTVASGWAQVGTTVDDGTDSSLTVLVKVVESSPPASWTLTNLFVSNETGVVGAVGYSGVNNSGPVDAAACPQGTQGATAAWAVGFTPTAPANNGSMLVAIKGCDAGSASRSAAPSGSPLGNERLDVVHATTFPWLFVWDYLQPTASTVTLNATASASESTAHFGVVLVPAGGAFEVDAQDDAYAVTGTAATVIAARLVSSDPAAYTFTGVLASLLATRLVSADAGAYAVTGFDTGLVYVPSTGDFDLDATMGAFLVSGSDASTLTDLTLASDPGAYVLTGYDIEFGQARIPILPAGENGYIADYGRGRIREQVLV